MTKRRKMLVVVLILAILLQFVAPLCQVVNAATGTEITLNQKLYEAVKASLIASKQASFSYSDSSCTIIITDTELAKVTELDLSESEISDLTGLSAFTSVNNLDLSGNDLTADSNLGEIDSLALASSSNGVLDLSSNKLESVKSITSFSNIYNTDIQNQEVTTSSIIEVDDSGEDENATYSTTYTITLPDILLEDESNNYKLNAGWFSSTSTGSCKVYWDNCNASTGTVDLIVASGSGANYSALEGLITITVDIKEKTYPNSDLVNTHMTLNYCVIGSGKTGIVFNDSNLYDAVKEQLTENQTINENLASYYGLDEPTTLYEAAYDDSLILIIDDDVLLNDITSLILNDIQVSDLTGLEKFVGLSSELNLSYNYIDSIEKLLELEENKEATETELQEKYAKALSQLSSDRETLMSYEEQLEGLTDEEEIEECEAYIDEYEENVSEDMQTLYDIYSKEYLLTTILTADTISLTVGDLSSATTSDLKTWASSIISKISTLEEDGGLTDWESDLIISTFDITTTGEEEYPISEYFSDADSVIDNYYTFVYEMKVLDSIITAANYCVYAQTFGDADECQFSESAFEQYIADLDMCGLDTTFAYLGLNSVDSYTDSCMCEENDISMVTLAGKLVNSSDLVTTLVKIPRLTYLDMTNNSLTSIEGIENLNQLKTLLLFQNFLGTGDISEVDWSAMTKLTTLDLGYNQLTFDDISCLTSLTNLQYLYLTKNLLAGSFSFDIIKLTNLQEADFSYNQISNISSYINAYQFKALGANMSISEYLLSDESPNVYFQYQTLSASVRASLTDSGTVTVTLPYIFREAESIDSTRTSFGIQSLYGSVDSTGETATFNVSNIGTYTGYVTIDGASGGNSNTEYYAVTSEGIAYGTVYTVELTVVEDGDDTVDVVVDGSTLDSSTLECVVSGSGTFLYTLTGEDLEDRNLTFDWSISGASSENTTIVDEGENLDSDNSKMTEYAVLTIGDDETADYITITVTTSEGATTTLKVKIEYTTDDTGDSGSSDDSGNTEDQGSTGDTGSTEDQGSTGDSGSTEDGGTTDVVTYTAEGDDGEEMTVEAGSTQDLTFTYTSSAVDSTWVANWTVSGASSESTTIVDYGEYITTGEQLTESATLTIGEDEDADTITVTVTLSNGDTRSVVFTKVGTTTDTDDTGSGSTESGSSSGTETGDSGSTTDDPEETTISYNYTISNDLVYVKTPGITVEDFENGLIETDGYVVEITNSEDAYDDSVLATSAIVTITTEGGDYVTSLEVVVLGDVNGDGKVNALDSGLIRSVINGTLVITGASYEAAADVNMDGSITKDDSVLVLQYRAKKITDFE